MTLINLKRTPLVLVLLTAALAIGLVSWGYKQSPGKYQQPINDTTPKKKTDREKKVRDLDDVLDELDRADFKMDIEKMQRELVDAIKKIDSDKIRIEIDKAMKELDLAKIQKEVQESLAKIDFKKIQEEMAQAMKEADVAAIQKEVQESLAKIDFSKIQDEMVQVMKEADAAKIQKEVQESLAKVDWDNIKAEMEKVKLEIKDIGPKIQKEMEKAKVEIEKAKAEMKELKGFVDGLDNDGLINKKEAYTIKHKDGELFINGKKASEQTYNKYRNFLEKHKKFNIEKEDDDFDVDID
jgi:chromosome segregation ATPase